MNDLEKVMKEGFDKAIESVKTDFETDRKPFMSWLQPLLDILISLAFYIYQAGFEDGMIYKETVNEPKEV